MGNIAYRTGRTLTTNPETGNIVNDPDAVRLAFTLPPGSYVFTAELRNAAGTTATKPITVTIRG